MRGRDCFFRPDINVDSIRLGSGYGGWNIPMHFLTDDSTVYSAGIGTDISFDLALIEQEGTQVHAFDPTPGSIKWLRKQELPRDFHYYSWGIADYDGVADFHIPRNPNHISHSFFSSEATRNETIRVPVKTIKSIMSDLGHDRIDLLKMDIEGAEYKVLENMLKEGIRPRLLLVEFHHRFRSIGAKETRRAVNDLQKAGYKLYYVAPSGEELCFMHDTQADDT